jgi:hypothetical protein
MTTCGGFERSLQLVILKIRFEVVNASMVYNRKKEIGIKGYLFASFF